MRLGLDLDRSHLSSTIYNTPCGRERHLQRNADLSVDQVLALFVEFALKWASMLRFGHLI
jgi:hypothetical protein